MALHASLVYIAISLVTGLAVITYKISACSLYALHAYTLPEEQNRASADKRSKKKDKKFVWNEDGSEILRVTIGDSYLTNTKYFSEYDQAFIFATLGLSLVLASEFLGCSSEQQQQQQQQRPSLLRDGLFFLVVTSFCVVKLIYVLCKVSWDRTSSRNSEWALSFGVAFVGFIAAALVIFVVPEDFLDFGLDRAMVSSGLDSRGKFSLSLLVAVAAALLTGLLLSPVLKAVRSFWVGTNQLGWDIPVVKTGSWNRFLLNLSVALPVLTVLLWCKPMAELFIKPATAKGWGDTMYEGQDWSANWGFSDAAFEDFKLAGLVTSGVIQLLLLRTNVQSYLNLGVLAWYESLHGTKNPDAKALKNKTIVINYFMCRVAVQFLVPAALVVLLAGMSRHRSSCSGLLTPELLSQAALFLSWWSVFSWSLLTCIVLAMFRLGLLLAY